MGKPVLFGTEAESEMVTKSILYTWIREEVVPVPKASAGSESTILLESSRHPNYSFQQSRIRIQCAPPFSTISFTYRRYLGVVCLLNVLPHFTKIKNVITCARPTNAARMNAFW